MLSTYYTIYELEWELFDAGLKLSFAMQAVLVPQNLPGSRF